MWKRGSNRIESGSVTKPAVDQSDTSFIKPISASAYLMGYEQSRSNLSRSTAITDMSGMQSRVIFGNQARLDVSSKWYQRQWCTVTKLVIVLSIPVGTILFLVARSMHFSLRTALELQNTKTSIHAMTTLATVASKLQFERGITCGYICSKGGWTEGLHRAYKASDTIIEGTGVWPPDLWLDGAIGSKVSFFQSLNFYRRKVVDLDMEVKEAIDFYTNAIETFLTWGQANLVTPSSDMSFWRMTVSTHLTLRALDAVGNKRALGVCYFLNGYLPDDLWSMFISVNRIGKSLLNASFEYANASQVIYKEKIQDYRDLAIGNFIEVADNMTSTIIRENHIKKEVDQTSSLLAEQWFEHHSKLIKAILDTAVSLNNDLVTTIDNLVVINKSKVIFSTVTTSIISVFCVLVSMYYLYRIFMMVRKISAHARKVKGTLKFVKIVSVLSEVNGNSRQVVFH